MIRRALGKAKNGVNSLGVSALVVIGIVIVVGFGIYLSGTLSQIER